MSGTWHFSSLKQLNEAIAKQRDDALREARNQFKCVFSRGTMLSTCKSNGEQCEPAVEADPHLWKRTWKEIAELVALVLDKYPLAAEVYISGGYDGSDSVRGRWTDGNYEPWISSWEVTVWSREASPSA